MNGDFVSLTYDALWLVLILSAPPIIVASIAGLLVAIIQAATQIQEQTLQYTVKFFAIVITLFVTASLLGASLYRFGDRVFTDFSGDDPRVNGWADQLLLLGVATARIAVAFALLPIFSTETVPAMVRNSVLISLGLISLVIQPPLDTSMIGATQWVAIFAKEVFVGLLIGFFFGSVLWALEAAGQIIDTKIGATLAQIVDPLSGHQTSLNGALLGRLAGVVFMFSGGLSLLVQVVMESYALWPIASTMPKLDPRGLALFEGEFGRLMLLATIFSAPVLTVLFLIDLTLGLMNRFAQQLNVFTLSLSIKSYAATGVILLLLGSYVEAIARDIQSRPDIILAILKGLSGVSDARLSDDERLAAIAELLRRADAAPGAPPPVPIGEHMVEAARVPKRHREALLQLTPTEITCIRFLGWGRSNADIGTLMLMAENTVRVHLSNVARKLELDGMRELTTLAGMLFYPDD